jgi:hypothetical protein
MVDEPTLPLDYGRPTPTPPSMRWLILLVVWTIGLGVWAIYAMAIGYLLFRVLL